ncbi:MAG TPA: hypothetical protein VMT69_05565 [Kineosporiaceae bacterium]|nr:hypothetical protein [Kineosporiaceae bacterium]
MSALPPTRSRRTALVVLVAAVTVLAACVIAAPRIVSSYAGVGSGTTAVNERTTGQGPAAGVPRGGTMNGVGGMMGGSAGMMSGRVWLAGDGVPVTSIEAARARAERAAAPAGLHPGEVIQFTANVYVELKDASGASVTEVLVDPLTGAVSTEPGPAMMWNTGTRSATVSTDQATSVATDWLRTHGPGESVASVDAYPGYYTIDTTVNGKPAGMLSVNATTGAVWYHTWHGGFVAEEDS